MGAGFLLFNEVSCQSANQVEKKLETLASEVQVSTFMDTDGHNWIQAAIHLSSTQYEVVDFFLDNEESIDWKGVEYGKVQLLSPNQQNSGTVTDGKMIIKIDVTQSAKLSPGSLGQAALPNGAPLPSEVYSALPAISPQKVLTFPLSLNIKGSLESLYFYFAMSQGSNSTAMMLGVAVPFLWSALTHALFNTFGFSSFSYPPVTAIAGIFKKTKSIDVNGFAIFIDVSHTKLGAGTP